MARLHSSAPKAEPPTKMIRSDEVSYCLTLSSPSSRMRWSITGTTISASARLRSRLSNVCSGSKRRRTTRVEPSASPSARWAKPRAWNIGTHSSVVSRERNGTLPSTPPMIDSDFGSLRGAPLGVPVVPLVRITILGPRPGLGGGLGELDRIRLSSVSSALAAPSPSTQARQRPCGGSSIPSRICEYSSS